MTDVGHYDIECPHCSHAFSVEVPRNLHVTRESGVRESILAGEFQRFSCPSCSAPVIQEPVTLYTDFERHHWYALFPTSAVVHRRELAKMVEDGFQQNMWERCAPIVREWAPYFQIRVVFGLPSLRDKLLCSDNNIDDRLLEVFKLQILRDHNLGVFGPRVSLFLDRVDGDQLVFVYVQPPEHDGTELLRHFSVSRVGLDKLQDQQWKLVESMPQLFSGLVVDWKANLYPEVPLDRDDVELGSVVA